MNTFRPKFKIPFSKTDWILEGIGLLLLAMIWIVVIMSYQQLPHQIPIHFNSIGEADSLGDKSMIFVLLVILTVLFIILTIINCFPHQFNYLTTITEENAHKEYTKATKMIRFLKIGIVLIFGIIFYKILNHK